MKLSPRMITDSWELKLTALGLAILLWAAVRSEDPARFTMRNVPVQVRVTDGSWVQVAAPAPSNVTVEFRGPVRELLRLAFAQATLVIPAEDVEDTLEAYRPRQEWLEYEGRFDNLAVDAVRPNVVYVSYQPIATRMVPVAVRLDTPLKATMRFEAPPSAQPARVMVQGPRNRVESIDSVVVHVTDVEAALRAGEVELPIDTAGLGFTVAPDEVLVRVRAVPVDTVPTSPVLGGAGWL